MKTKKQMRMLKNSCLARAHELNFNVGKKDEKSI